MKLQVTGTANRRISNIEPQNVEVWFRFAQSFFKIDRIHYFDIHYSIFDIRFFRVSFSIRLAAFQASGGADTRHPNPATRSLSFSNPKSEIPNPQSKDP
jgi:hypothetical protein